VRSGLVTDPADPVRQGHQAPSIAARTARFHLFSSRSGRCTGSGRPCLSHDSAALPGTFGSNMQAGGGRCSTAQRGGDGASRPTHPISTQNTHKGYFLGNAERTCTRWARSSAGVGRRCPPRGAQVAGRSCEGDWLRLGGLARRGHDGNQRAPPAFRRPELRDRLHLIATSAPLTIRGREVSLGSHAGPAPRRGRRQALTAANLIVLIPWLVFAAAVAAISWRLLVSRHPRNRR
jgi:hypothetical protein